MTPETSTFETSTLEAGTNTKRREPRSRFKPQAQARMRLEERDEQLLCDLLLHRAMSREQIQTLYFSSLVRCNARLRLLFDYRFVMRHYPPAAPFGAQAIYTLGKAGVPVVARHMEMELPEVARLARSSYTPTFLEHTLAVTDISIAFRQAASAQDDVKIERWLPEAQCHHEWELRPASGGKWKKEVFKPDGFVRLLHRGNYHNFFIEADLGHTSSKQFIGKLLTHQRYLESGLFEQTYGSQEFRTLVITTGLRRLKNLMLLCQQHNSALFWFGTFADMKSQGISGTIWHSPLDPNQKTLLA